MKWTKLNEFIICKFVSSDSWKHQYCVKNDTTNVTTEAGQAGLYDSGVVNSVLEVDNRIVCHISEIISKGYSKIMVHTVDSDAVVILLGFMSEFMAANTSVEITINFKTSSVRKYISINSIYSNLWSDICSGLPFFHSFTWADSTCSFFKQSKKVWFGKWLDFPMKEDFVKMPKERHRWWLPSFDATICCLYLSKKIWFHWLWWIAPSNVCKFELKCFQNITTIQRCPIPTSTAGILSIGIGMGEFIVAGSSSSEGVIKFKNSQGEFNSIGKQLTAMIN